MKKFNLIVKILGVLLILYVLFQQDKDFWSGIRGAENPMAPETQAEPEKQVEEKEE